MGPGWLERLRRGETLLADGATGTLLQQRGLGRGDCPEEWNVSHPEVVGSIAADYARAGSDLVYTNTFGGNRLKLARYGFGDRVAEFNEAGARVARAAVGDGVLVVGSIGMTGQFLQPLGERSFDEMVEVFAEQAQALAAGGVDAIVTETFAALDELEAAMKAVKEYTDRPLLASMSFEANGRTMMGVTPEQAVAVMREAGADVIGANCGHGLEEMWATMEKMRAVSEDVPLLAKPNAGTPRPVGEQVFYEASPAEMAAYALKFRDLGVAIVGGCCGSTPAHIAAMAQAMRA